jgi:hypothetical protein
MKRRRQKRAGAEAGMHFTFAANATWVRGRQLKVRVNPGEFGDIDCVKMFYV